MEKKYTENLINGFYGIVCEYHADLETLPKYMFDLVNHEFFKFDENNENQKKLFSKNPNRFIDVPYYWIWDLFRDFLEAYYKKNNYTKKFADDILQRVIDGSSNEIEYEHCDTGKYFCYDISGIDTEIAKAYDSIRRAGQNQDECEDEVKMLRMWGFDPADEYYNDDWGETFLREWNHYRMEFAKKELEAWEKENAAALENSFA